MNKLQTNEFLHYVARGQRLEAEELLNLNPKAHFLLQKDTFTDYSGRTFHCTAYEYAYWAKDRHMCRMLEYYMDEATKAELLKRCLAIEKLGLTYTQAGKTNTGSKHFDLNPLINALDEYVLGFDKEHCKWDYDKQEALWMKIGIAQRDVPAHVAQEYCRDDRSFDPRPDFNEPNLPEEATYFNYLSNQYEPWFPLHISDSEGLGVNYALCVGSTGVSVEAVGFSNALTAELITDIDRKALRHLDKVRTADLEQSIEHLKNASGK